MSSSKSRDKRRDKYNPEPEKNFMIHRGQKVPLGGAAEMLRHCDAQWVTLRNVIELADAS